MAEIVRTTKRLLIIYYLITLHVVAVYFVTDRIARTYTIEPRANVEDEKRIEPVASVMPTAVPETTVAADNAANYAKPVLTAPISPPTGLIIPVAGVKREQLTDSFKDARSEGRIHDAIDIPAPAGTPVVAAANGRIVKFFDSKDGGTTIYQLSADEKFVYYYAHLQRRADDVKEGDLVKQGTTIGFVGDTGNAGAGNFHLHFSVSAISDPKRYWNGVSIDPYPLLRY
jgi:murein DD-endopeptidase MepM/ murein hydrolase activator NlpD